MAKEYAEQMAQLESAESEKSLEKVMGGAKDGKTTEKESGDETGYDKSEVVGKVAAILDKGGETDGSGETGGESEDAGDGTEEEAGDVGGEESEETGETESDDAGESLDRGLVEIAVKAGIPLSVAEKFDSNAELDRAVQGMLRNIKPPEKEKVEESKDPLDDLKLNGEDWDDDIVAVVEGLKEQIRSLRDKLLDVDDLKQKSEEIERDRGFQAFVNDFEGELAKLPEAGKKLFGEGRLDDVKDSKLRENRLSLFNEVGRLARSYSQTGRDVDLGKLVKIAANVLFDDALSKANVGEKLKKRSGTVVKKPNNRNVTAEPTEPKERAVSKIRELFRSWSTK